MFHIIGDVISCIVWGTLIGLLSTLGIVYLLKKIVSLANWNLVCMGIFLFLLLSFQISTLLAARKANGYISSIQPSANTVNLNQSLGEIENYHPVLKPFIAKLNDNMNMATASQATVFASIKDIIKSYSWRRVAWITGIILFTFGLAVLLDSMKKPVRKTHRNNDRQVYKRRSHARRR